MAVSASQASSWTRGGSGGQDREPGCGVLVFGLGVGESPGLSLDSVFEVALGFGALADVDHQEGGVHERHAGHYKHAPTQGSIIL